MLSTYEFDSISQFAAYVQAAKQSTETDRQSSIDKNDGNKWDGGWSYEEAVEVGLNGGLWPEGAKKMRTANIETSKALRVIEIEEPDYNVTGHTLDIGEYLAGNPVHWINDGEEGELPIVSIGVSCSRSFNTTSRQIINRGAAILSLVDKLESDGLRVELWAVGNQEGGGVSANVRVLVKAADANWSPSAAAFALAHPTFSRRLMFRMFETHDDLAPLTYNGYGGAYGRGEAADQYDYFFTGFTSGFYDAESAMREVLSDYEFQKAEKERLQ